MQGLAKLKGGLWHPYRRRWASDRLHLPLKAVANAGGWKDVMTLVKCYQQTDDATLKSLIAAKCNEDKNLQQCAWRESNSQPFDP
jgi:hypothetical protein